MAQDTMTAARALQTSLDAVFVGLGNLFYERNKAIKRKADPPAHLLAACSRQVHKGKDDFLDHLDLLEIKLNRAEEILEREHRRRLERGDDALQKSGGGAGSNGKESKTAMTPGGDSVGGTAGGAPGSAGSKGEHTANSINSVPASADTPGSKGGIPAATPASINTVGAGMTPADPPGIDTKALASLEVASSGQEHVQGQGQEDGLGGGEMLNPDDLMDFPMLENPLEGFDLGGDGMLDVSAPADGLAGVTGTGLGLTPANAGLDADGDPAAAGLTVETARDSLADIGAPLTGMSTGTNGGLGGGNPFDGLYFGDEGEDGGDGAANLFDGFLEGADGGAFDFGSMMQD
ncbi:hypothetical protein PYCC9005_004802 [Savitreella phatthalungensis]